MSGIKEFLEFLAQITVFVMLQLIAGVVIASLLIWGGVWLYYLLKTFLPFPS